MGRIFRLNSVNALPGLTLLENDCKHRFKGGADGRSCLPGGAKANRINELISSLILF